MTTKNKIYLGDGLYCEWLDNEPYAFRTYCFNGVEESNEQFWEMRMFDYLLELIDEKFGEKL